MSKPIHLHMSEMAASCRGLPHCFILSHEAMTEYMAWRNATRGGPPVTLPEIFRGASVSAHFDPTELHSHLVSSGYDGISIEAFR